MENTLQHHGILGQKWGVRRYQNADGSLTEEGRKRYAKIERKEAEKNLRETYEKGKYAAASSEEFARKKYNAWKKYDKLDKQGKDYKNSKAYAEHEKYGELQSKSRKYERELARKAQKEYDSFVSKYGDATIKDLTRTSYSDTYGGSNGFLNELGGHVTAKCRREINNILYKNAFNGTLVGTLVAGPIGGIAAASVGAAADSRKQKEYIRTISNTK